jgi:hypothetical protein
MEVHTMYAFYNTLSFCVASAIGGWLIQFSNQFTCGCVGFYDEYANTSGLKNSLLDTILRFIAQPIVIYPIAALLPGLILYKAYYFKRDRRRARRKKNREFKRWKHKLEKEYVMRPPGQ